MSGEQEEAGAGVVEDQSGGQHASNSFVLVPFESNDVSVARMNPSDMDARSCFAGDSINVSFRRRVVTLIVLKSDQCDQGSLEIGEDSLPNIAAEFGDRATVTVNDSLAMGGYVHLLPYRDTMEGVDRASLFDTFLKPFFFDAYRPVNEGITLPIRAGDSTVYFRVMSVSPQGRRIGSVKSVIVDNDTVISCEGDPLDRRAVASMRRVGGLSREKRELREALEPQLYNPTLFKSMGIKPTNGVLMWGPPGTGKSALASGFCMDHNFYTMHIKGPELVDKFAGASEELLREAFDKAKLNAPAFVLIDALDAIAPPRVEKGFGSLEYRLTAQLLSLMDGLSNHENVIVIGSTDRVSSIDPSLRQCGRFTTEIEFKLPDEGDRVDILLMCSQSMDLSGDVDFGALANATAGFSLADLAQVCQNAGLACLKQAGAMEFLTDCERPAPSAAPPTGASSDPEVTQAHLVEAIQSLRNARLQS